MSYSSNILLVVTFLTIKTVVVICCELLGVGEVLFAFTTFETVWMIRESNSSNNLSFNFLSTFLAFDDIFITILLLYKRNKEKNNIFGSLWDRLTIKSNINILKTGSTLPHGLMPFNYLVAFCTDYVVRNCKILSFDLVVTFVAFLLVVILQQV